MKETQIIPLESGEKQNCPLPYDYNYILEFLARTKRQLKEIKGYKLERKKSEYSYLRYYDSIHMLPYSFHQEIPTTDKHFQ